MRETRSERPEPPASGERSSASFLVRCWFEPREEAGAPPILRGYVKNLKTGEEMFIKDLDTVGDEILRYLGPDATVAPDEWPETGDATDAGRLAT